VPERGKARTGEPQRCLPSRRPDISAEELSTFSTAQKAVLSITFVGVPKQDMTAATHLLSQHATTPLAELCCRFRPPPTGSTTSFCRRRNNSHLFPERHKKVLQSETRCPAKRSALPSHDSGTVVISLTSLSFGHIRTYLEPHMTSIIQAFRNGILSMSFICCGVMLFTAPDSSPCSAPAFAMACEI
jgi:hypothetical protein